MNQGEIALDLLKQSPGSKDRLSCQKTCDWILSIHKED
jgi:hypothetical protein